MNTVVVSPKFQVVIPRKVREQMGLRPGRKLEAIYYDGELKLIPVMTTAEARGFLGAFDTTIEREPDREFRHI